MSERDDGGPADCMFTHLEKRVPIWNADTASDAEKLHALATWLDTSERFSDMGAGDEVQRDLRRIADEIERLRAENDALNHEVHNQLNRVEQLRDALAPFANASDRYPNSWAAWEPVAFTLGDCRRARTALKETEQ